MRDRVRLCHQSQPLCIGQYSGKGGSALDISWIRWPHTTAKLYVSIPVQPSCMIDVSCLIDVRLAPVQTHLATISYSMRGLKSSRIIVRISRETKNRQRADRVNSRLENRAARSIFHREVRGEGRWALSLASRSRKPDTG